LCPQPFRVETKTGWFGERSLAYLASGRPVLARDTGQRLPAGLGLLIFRNMKEAVAGVAENRRPLRAAPPPAAIYLGAGRADPLQRNAK